MNNGLEESLRVAQIGDLPPEIDKDYKKHWLKAIVKIQRANGYIGYCLAVNDGNGGANIIRDFNPTGIIVNILSIHPYEEVTRNIIPRFANDAQVIKYLCKSDFKRSDVEPLLVTEGKTPEQIKADREIVKGYISQVAAKQARALEETKRISREMNAMADPKLKEKNIKAKKYGRTTPTKTKRSKSQD